MNKIFNLTSTFKSHSAEDGSVMIRGMASTSDFDRAGDSISSEAWTKGGLTNFEKNPIILFNHDYDKPIGRATGLKVTPNGLELEAKISKSAPAAVCELIKDGVLGAFSVGFRVKDADYLEETDGLKIKDAELFEVSVVSVPCNQTATFSLAKSFDSLEEYESFKKTFTNRVDLAGQLLAKDEDTSSNIASDTPDGTKKVQKEIQMDNESNIDLEAFAKKVAEETAAKIAMKQAEQKAAEKADAEKARAEAEAQAEAKAQQEESVKQAIVTGVESGSERLMADVEAKLAEKDADIADTLAHYKKELEEKSEEITKMRESKRVFSDRSSGNDLSGIAKELAGAHLYNVITKSDFTKGYGADILEKAGVSYTSTSAAGIDVTVATQIEKDVMLELKVAQAFREVNVNGAVTVLPIQPDSAKAVFGSGSNFAANLAEAGGSAGTFASSQVLLKAHRLISSTFLENDIDEQVLVNLLPMLQDAVVRAHARAIDDMVVNGVSVGATIGGLLAAAPTATTTGAALTMQAADVLVARALMGRYGINPQDLAIIVSVEGYNDLIQDTNFADITDVGSNVATKLIGSVGAIYGSPVYVTDAMTGATTGSNAGIVVNTRNYVIPRLRGVSLEQDYEVGNQRRVIVASQSLGFNELVGGATGNEPVIKLALQ